MRAALLLASFAATPALALTAAPESERDLARILDGATAGKPTACLPAFDRREGRNLPGIGILYGSGRRFYLNRFQPGCAGFDTFDILVTNTPTGDLCRGDIVRFVDSGSHIEHGSCVFGDFIPYTKAAKKR